MSIDPKSIALLIDHAVLKPDATDDDVQAGAKIALQYKVASLCIRPSDAILGASLLAGSSVKLSTVIGFPHGGDTLPAKLKAVEVALNQGVQELDVVLNIGQLRSENIAYVDKEIKEITEAIHDAGQQVKIIFENCYLDTKHKLAACQICNEANVDWVKTSTGFGTGGATEEDVVFMRDQSLYEIGVKASGGIRTLDDLLKFKELGCSRIGASATASILDDLKRRLELGMI